jgi:hypothetical protein
MGQKDLLPDVETSIIVTEILAMPQAALPE